MRTRNPTPGRFEGNPSQMLAAAAHQASLECSDLIYGDVQEKGMHITIVEGRRWTFVVEEDSQGFVTVVPFDRVKEGQLLQNTLLNIESWDASS